VHDQSDQERQLIAVFQVEYVQRVNAIEQLIDSLGGSGGVRAHADILAALTRETHSLKGAARAVEEERIEQWAHAFEEALMEALRSDRAPAPEWITAAQSVVTGFARPADAESALDMSRFPEILAVSTSVPHSTAIEPADTAFEVRRLLPKAGAGDGSEQAIGASAAMSASVQPSSDNVRVSVGKLDTLLAQAGELAVTHIRLAQRLTELRETRDSLSEARRDRRKCRTLRAAIRRTAVTRDVEALLLFTEQAEERSLALSRRIEELSSRLQQDVAQLALVSQELAADILGIRLLPAATVLNPLERVVRDLAGTQHKEIRLLTAGREIEVDRRILEQLRDPLLHMIRNSIDHGIETPEEREACGKTREGTIKVSVAQRGDAVEIVLEDDGAGMDPELIRLSAIRKGFLSEESARALDDQAALDLIFRAGFSTKTTVTEISGRGVGMDVVHEHLERLAGRITIWSIPGRGTRFTIRVPLTLATTRAILVEQSGQVFAIPSTLIERTSRVREPDIVSLEGRRAVAVEGRPVPLVELCEVLELPPSAGREFDAKGWRSYLVLRQDEGRVALAADQLIGEQEIVVKQLAWPLRRVRNVGGAAVLGSGQTIAILNPADLLKTALKTAGARGRRATGETPISGNAPRQRCVLVVDDSLPTRTLERSILETAGYSTFAAGDGVEALKILRRETIDLVVSDIEMPNLDGFALTTEIRREEKLRRIPVVLITSLASPEHQERGMVAGADAYILKGKFDQGQLLDTVGRLIT
jgi:two-component system chemotaxis sensor kinase CheA